MRSWDYFDIEQQRNMYCYTYKIMITFTSLIDLSQITKIELIFKLKIVNKLNQLKHLQLIILIQINLNFNTLNIDYTYSKYITHASISSLQQQPSWKRARRALCTSNHTTTHTKINSPDSIVNLSV